MNRARVLIASDRLSAEVQVGPGAPAPAADLQSALRAAGVVFGIDDAAVAALATGLADAHFQGRAIVARGRAAVAGRDGEVRLPFATAPQPGHRTDDDAIDYRERALLHPAAAGAEVAVVVAPTPGTPGCDVSGRPLAPPATKAAALRLGGGVALQPDGRVLATRDGVVTMPAGGIDVVELHEHRGDVDLHSGNLHSHGSLLVNGDVHAGFQVDADGDVAIRGSCFGGRVLAGGRVEIGLGVQAGASVEAGGDLQSRHATNAQLTADGTIHIRDELVHCEVAAAAIELVEGRGLVLGGALRARSAIAVLTAGNSRGTQTLLSVADLTSAQQELVRRARQHERLERRTHKVGERRNGPQKGGKLGRQLAATGDRAQQERLELARRQRELLRSATIEVRHRIHAGVRVQFGSCSRAIAEDRQGARFRWHEADGTIAEEAP